MRLSFELKILVDPDAEMTSGADVAEALRTIANTIEARTHEGLEKCESRVWDRNGNPVGRWKIKTR